MQKKTRGDGMKYLETVLKAYSIHYDKDKACTDCPYDKKGCIELYKYVARLRNKKKEINMEKD